MSRESLSDRPFQRAVVLLDAALGGIAALEAASMLAAAVAERLEVVFVEDERLHRAAAYPFAREVSLRASAARTLDAVTIARDLRASAERARAVAEAAARASRIEWRFEVVRGRVERTLAKACVGSGLVAIEGRRDLGIGQLLTPVVGTGPAGASLLVVGPRARYRQGPVLVHADESDSALPARRLAGQIARQTGQILVEIADVEEFAVALGVNLPRPRPWRYGTTTVSRPGIAVIGRATWPRPDMVDLLLKESICPVLLTGLGAQE